MRRWTLRMKRRMRKRRIARDRVFGKQCDIDIASIVGKRCLITLSCMYGYSLCTHLVFGPGLYREMSLQAYGGCNYFH